MDEEGKFLVVMVVKGIVSGFCSDAESASVWFQTGLISATSMPASCSLMGVMWCRLVVVACLVPVLGLLQGIALVRLLSGSTVVSSRTCVRMVIRLVEVWSVWGLVQRGTCAFVGLRSSIDLAAWTVAVRFHSLSE